MPDPAGQPDQDNLLIRLNQPLNKGIAIKPEN